MRPGRPSHTGTTTKRRSRRGGRCTFSQSIFRYSIHVNTIYIIRISVYSLRRYLQKECTRVLVRPCSHLKRCLPRVLLTPRHLVIGTRS
jgi:hypothetical protein